MAVEHDEVTTRFRLEVAQQFDPAHRSYPPPMSRRVGRNVAFDLSILERDGAIGDRRNVALVRDDHDGRAATGKRAEQVHHLAGRLGIEVAGRLVRRPAAAGRWQARAQWPPAAADHLKVQRGICPPGRRCRPERATPVPARDASPA